MVRIVVGLGERQPIYRMIWEQWVPLAGVSFYSFQMNILDMRMNKGQNENTKYDLLVANRDQIHFFWALWRFREKFGRKRRDEFHQRVLLQFSYDNFHTHFLYMI